MPKLFNQRLHTCFINLDKDSEKRHRMWDFIKKMQPGAHSRIEAVNGNELEEINIDINFKDHSGRNITKGEVGCALSHVKAWKACIEVDQLFLVFEDDAVTDTPMDKVLVAIDEAIELLGKDEADFVYLGRQPLRPEMDTGRWVRPNFSWLTHAYMVSPKGAKLLLDEYYLNNIIPVDEWIPFKIGRGCDPYVEYCYKENNPEKLRALAYYDPDLFYQDRESHEGSETEISDQIHVNEDITEFSLVTVATDPNNIGLRYLINSAEKHEVSASNILGLEQEWRGGDVANSKGAGQKINFLREHLNSCSDEEVILFLDGYDTLILDDASKIIRRWRENFNVEQVLFAAEKICWPEESISDRFKAAASGYSYLNSGCFIGKVKYIKEIINSDIEDADDDQYFYQLKYLDGDNIELDTECLLFQCLSDALQDIVYDDHYNLISNTKTKTIPLIVHGNGGYDIKQAYLGLCNEINNFYKGFREWIGPR